MMVAKTAECFQPKTMCIERNKHHLEPSALSKGEGRAEIPSRSGGGIG